MKYMHTRGGLQLPAPTREEVRSAAVCPTCGAVAGEECRESAGASRERNHIARRLAALEILDTPEQRWEALQLHDREQG